MTQPVEMSQRGDERAEAAALIALYDERIAMTKAMAQHPHPTGAMAQAVLDKGAELDAACEAFRRRYYPRKHRVLVGLRTVMAASRTGRSVVTVFDPEIPRVAGHVPVSATVQTYGHLLSDEEVSRG